MRIGLFSDVHGNLCALRAVAAALEREEWCDQVIVAGDHVSGGPRPREVWAALRARPWLLLRGNHDEELASPSVVGTPGDEGPYRAAARRLHAWTRAALEPAVLRALAALPPAHRLTTPAGDLLVVHASPRGTDDRFGGPHNTLAQVAAAYGGTGAAVIAFGHYHQSFVRPTPVGLLVNVASVGLPKDGQPLAAYTILTATEEGWVIEQRRVPYDAAEEAAIARAVDLPAWTPDGSDE
jgi:predicted phosphodiesterase